LKYPPQSSVLTAGLRFAKGKMTPAELVFAIEQGRYSATSEMALRIARVFGVPLDDVFQYPDSPEVTT
jgi:putative transcriptional regulator